MNIGDIIKEARKSCEKQYTLEEVVSICAPLGIHPKIIASVASLICNQPERLNPENRCDRCGYPKEDPCRNCLLDKALE